MSDPTSGPRTLTPGSVRGSLTYQPWRSHCSKSGDGNAGGWIMRIPARVVVVGHVNDLGTLDTRDRIFAKIPSRSELRND